MGCTSCNSSICSCSCDITSLPTGSDGLNGYNAYTKTTNSFIVPNVGSNTTIDVSNLGQYTGEWAGPGQLIYIEGAGYYEVISSTNTQIVAKNTGSAGNAAPLTTITSNKSVSPGGVQGLPGTPGANGTNGTNGVSLVWLSDSPTPPSSPNLNEAYYNTTDKKSYVWNGTSWQTVAEDGATGPQGPPGPDGSGPIYISYDFNNRTPSNAEFTSDSMPNPGAYEGRYFYEFQDVDSEDLIINRALHFYYPGTSVYTKTPTEAILFFNPTSNVNGFTVNLTDANNGTSYTWIADEYVIVTAPGYQTRSFTIDPLTVASGEGYMVVTITLDSNGHYLNLYSLTIKYE
jgi:hypothetical protein